MVHAEGGGATREKRRAGKNEREYNYPLATENKLKEERGPKVEMREQSEKNKKGREKKREKRRRSRARRNREANDGIGEML